MMQEILTAYSDKKTGVIVNEFGEINIDAKLIQKDGVQMAELSNGSIFCACIKDKFVDSLIELSYKDLDYLFIEASGLADPANMNQILEIMGQQDAGDVLVESTWMSVNDLGRVTGLEMKLLNLVSQSNAEMWTLTADEEGATLRRDEVLYENLSSRKLRMMDFQTYYPGLSRVSSAAVVDYLRANFPVGESGVYTFTDNFGNNVDPDFNSYLERGLPGIWVPKTGQISVIQEGYQRILKCAPTVMSIQLLESQKQLFFTRNALSEPEEVLVVLFEAANY